MTRAAIVGLGRWGRTLVNSVQGKSGKLRFTHAVSRDPERVQGFTAQHGLQTVRDLDAVLAVREIDAVVLATPHSLHAFGDLTDTLLYYSKHPRDYVWNQQYATFSVEYVEKYF